MKTVELTKEECHVSLTTLFKNIAEKSGYEVSDNMKFDCTKIHVTPNVQDEVFDYYISGIKYSEKDDLLDFEAELGGMWACYGPKADMTLPDYGGKYYAAFETGAFACHCINQQNIIFPEK